MHFAVSRQHLKRFLLLLPLLAHGTALAHNDFNVLVFTAANGTSHASTPVGIAAIQELATEHHFRVTTASTAESFINANAGLGHHQAGCIRFDTSGNLIIATGDNADHSSYSARNDTNIAEDARKSAVNTNDLRGRFLRITPKIGGGPSAHPNYTIPSGNLREGSPQSLPLLYRSLNRMDLLGRGWT